MVERFKFLGTTLTNQNSIQEDNHSTLQSGNACCHSVKNLLTSSLLSKIINMKTLRTVILSFILYGYENWSLTLKEEITNCNTQFKFKNYMYIKWVDDDELHYESSWPWAPCILNRGRERKSTKNWNKMLKI